MSSENSSSSSSSSSRSSKGPGEETTSEIKDGCEQDTTSNPVKYATGDLILEESDLASNAFGLAWGHTRSYANIFSNNAAGINGASWIVREQKYLAFVGGGSPADAPAKICVVIAPAQSLWFVRTLGGSFEPQFGGLAQLEWDLGHNQYTLSYGNGWRTAFYDLLR